MAGDGWEVTNLTAAGQRAARPLPRHHADRALEEADLVVLEHGFQPAVDETVEANVADAEIVDAADVVELMPASTRTTRHESTTRRATTTATSTRTSGRTRC